MTPDQIQAIIERTRERCKIRHPFSYDVKNGEIVDGDEYANGFDYFIRNVFSASFISSGGLIYGKYIRDVAVEMNDYQWTMDISARDHFKSTRLYACVMYDIFCSEQDIECHYFSYMSSMSAYHIAKIKKMISENPFFTDIIDKSFGALASIRVINHYGKIYSCVPQGLLTFKRGIHAERVYIDDPLKDPENKLAPRAILQVNNVMKMEIFPMIKKGGHCRIVGTPQTNVDFFFDENMCSRYHRTIKPAIVDEAKKIALFPEWKDYDELCRIRHIIGEKPFNQEYMTKPSYTEDAYIERARLMKVVDKDLEECKNYNGDYDVVGGMDLGKKAHPSHLVLYERRRDNETGKWKYKQLLSKWFDGVDYSDQLTQVKMLVEQFKVVKLRYDNTRAEFEAFAEQGILPACMEPVVFGMRKNQEMAVSLDTVVKEERVRMLDDTRQIDQILQVNSELQAVESPLGHGDSFWSNALALYEPVERRPHFDMV